jgi:hypothetical protein
MMHKSLITAISSLATIALLSITTVHAATYNFTFQSSGAELTATGQFTIDATDQVTGFPASSPGWSIRQSTRSPPIQENGSLSVTPVPELSTWAMIATGFAGLGLVGRRRRTARLAPSLG